MPIKSEILPDKIDDSLADGLAKELFNDIAAITKKGFGKPVMTAGTNSKAMRKKSCQKLLAAYGPLVFDKVATPDFSTLRVMHLCPGIFAQSQKMLNVSVDTIQLRRLNRVAYFGGVSGLEVDQGGSVGAISMHAVARMIQDARVRTPRDLMAVAGKALSWGGVANKSHHKGAFMVPVETGLICCGTVLPVSKVKGGPKEARGVLVKTFIGHSRMKLRYKETWQRLVDLGGMEHTPRAIVRKDFPGEAIRAFEAMANAGRRWEERQPEPSQGKQF